MSSHNAPCRCSSANPLHFGLYTDVPLDVWHVHVAQQPERGTVLQPRIRQLLVHLYRVPAARPRLQLFIFASLQHAHMCDCVFQHFPCPTSNGVPNPSSISSHARLESSTTLPNHNTQNETQTL
eukprot:353502-Chlamydomonas_euryale.AAC.3